MLILNTGFHTKEDNDERVDKQARKLKVINNKHDKAKTRGNDGENEINCICKT
jgi:hypothetical protein